MRTTRKKYSDLIAALLCLVLLTALGCSRRVDGIEGSDTNWLRHCDDDSDCRDLSCVCGLCTRACSSVEDCSGSVHPTECRDSDSVSACAAFDDAPARACFEPCGADGSCAGDASAPAPVSSTSSVSASDAGAALRPVGIETTPVESSMDGGDEEPDTPSCGDGVRDEGERCDDGNVTEGDGCATCRVEPGFACDAECHPTVCGDGTTEGDEWCDDGNRMSFDGCSETCELEECGEACETQCGDGHVWAEGCDDGNWLDGDGCSSCTLESGFTCVDAPECPQRNGTCVLALAATFRDFPETHTDFNVRCGEETPVTGLVDSRLGADGKPVLRPEREGDACIGSADSFAEWYSDAYPSDVLTKPLILFESEPGTFVNRFGPDGEPFEAITDGGGNERGAYGTTRGQCEQICGDEECADKCPPTDVEAAQAAWDEAEANGASEAELDDLQEQIDAARAARTECLDACPTTTETERCTADCNPCSYSFTQDQWCRGGERVAFDGNPLFFPVDELGVPPNCTAEVCGAKIPDEYGYNGWPWEDEVFGTTTRHNFSFTSEIRYSARYNPSLNPTILVGGDDDIWVFVNGRLAIDLGGPHVPSEGSVALADAEDELGLVHDELFEIAVFHAEREHEGSTLKLELSGILPRFGSWCAPEN